MSLKEQVKAGKITAKDALVEFEKTAVDTDGNLMTKEQLREVNTYRWLKKKATRKYSKPKEEKK